MVIDVFAYEPAVLAAFPGLRVGALHATELVNGPSPAGLRAAYGAEQDAARARLRATPIAELPSIAAWRRAFSQFGAKPTQHRNAAEALLRRLDKQGEIPSIGALVDIGNLVSIRHALPVACFDLAGIDGGLTVRFATGAEPFADLGSSDTVHPDPGEVVFVDRNDVVSARRWCWRQGAESATSECTTDALIVVEGQHAGAGDDVAAAVGEIETLLASFLPGSRVAPLALP
jgi:DNA/RNA-binding domain of Phe-tRNA-synthetase-like protein